MALLRLVVILLGCLGVIYFSLFHYLCALRREQLDRGFSTKASTRDRATFVEAGVRAYAGRLKRRLAAGVFGIPLIVIAVYIVVTNPL